MDKIRVWLLIYAHGIGLQWTLVGRILSICTLNADIHENSGTPMGIGDGEAANVIAPVSPDGDHF
jgi:hypothetical protein